MLRWLKHLRAPTELGSPAAWELLLTPAKLSNGFISQYALGLEVYEYREVRVIRHSGGVVGGSSQLLSVPDHALDVFVATNGAAVPVGEIGIRIAEAVLGEDVFERKTEDVGADAYSHVLGQYYCPETGMLLGIENVRGKVGVSLVGGAPVLAEQSDAGLVVPFIKTGAGNYVIHCTAQASRVPCDELRISDCGKSENYRRVGDNAPSVDERWSNRSFTFRSAETKSRAILHTTTGKLQLRINGPYGSSTWDLCPLNGRLLLAANSVLPVWTAVVDLRGDAGELVGFEMSTRRTRKLAFTRAAEQ